MELGNSNKENTLGNAPYTGLPLDEKYKLQTTFQGFYGANGELIEKVKGFVETVKEDVDKVKGKGNVENVVPNGGGDAKQPDKNSTTDTAPKKSETKILGMHPLTFGLVGAGVVVLGIITVQIIKHVKK